MKMVIADIQNMGPLVAKGEADSCICLPDFAINEFRTGKLRMLYDDRSDAQMVQDEVQPGHQGPMINIFLARKDFAEANPEAINFFLELWQRGLDEWKKNRDKIIEAYPQDFARERPGGRRVDQGFWPTRTTGSWTPSPGPEVGRRGEAGVRFASRDRLHGGGPGGSRVRGPQPGAERRRARPWPTLHSTPAPRLAGRRWRQAGAVVVGWAVFFGIWAFRSNVLFNPFRLPPPDAVFEAMRTIVTSGDVLTHFKASLGKIFMGFAAGRRARHADRLPDGPVRATGGRSSTTW